MDDQNVAEVKEIQIVSTPSRARRKGNKGSKWSHLEKFIAAAVEVALPEGASERQGVLIQIGSEPARKMIAAARRMYKRHAGYRFRIAPNGSNGRELGEFVLTAILVDQDAAVTDTPQSSVAAEAEAVAA